MCMAGSVDGTREKTRANAPARLEVQTSSAIRFIGPRPALPSRAVPLASTCEAPGSQCLPQPWIANLGCPRCGEAALHSGFLSLRHGKLGYSKVWGACWLFVGIEGMGRGRGKDEQRCCERLRVSTRVAIRRFCSSLCYFHSNR
jgi:hypothetical protein